MSNTRQFSSFKVGGRLFGIDVREVQEVTRALPVTPLRKSPKFILGLVNLRGQLSTAVGLAELFGIEPEEGAAERMAVVCQGDTVMLSLLVDQIGDVIEVDGDMLTEVPGHLDPKLRRLISGVYRLDGALLSVLEVDRIVANLVENPPERSASGQL